MHKIRARHGIWISFEVAFVSLSLLMRTSRSQVPGLVRTESGYDTLRGKDALCWFSSAFESSNSFQHNDENAALPQQQQWLALADDNHDAGALEDDFDGVLWPNSLFPDFKSGPTTLMRSCPAGTFLQVQVIPKKVAGSFIFRTGHYYVFRVTAEIDLQVIRRQFHLSDDSFFSGDAGLRIEFCAVRMRQHV